MDFGIRAALSGHDTSFRRLHGVDLADLEHGRYSEAPHECLHDICANASAAGLRRKSGNADRRNK